MLEASVFIGALLGSALLTGLIRVYADRTGLIDTPNERSSHERPTPRGGGLSIIIVFMLLLVALFMLRELPFRVAAALSSGGVLVGAIGFVDDHGHVSPLHRIFVHFFAAIVVIYFAGGLSGLQIGESTVSLGWYGTVLSIIFLVWLTNLFNFMDGIDGLAAVESAFIIGAAVGIGGSSVGGYMMMQVGLLAAIIGFLLWNFPPAKIFLGDVGSGFLGITLGAVAVASSNLGIIPIWTWLILAGVFIVDATTTVVRRMINRERWYAAHRNHLYQHAARRWNSHGRVLLAVTVVNIGWLLPMAVWSAIRPDLGWLLLIVAWVPLVIAALGFGAGVSRA